MEALNEHTVGGAGTAAAQYSACGDCHCPRANRGCAAANAGGCWPRGGWAGLPGDRGLSGHPGQRLRRRGSQSPCADRRGANSGRPGDVARRGHAVSADRDHGARCEHARTLAAIARAREQEPILRRAIPGVHLEGPFLSPEDGPRGAHPAASIRDPDWDLFRGIQEAAGGLIRLVTIAPERPGAIGVISQLRQAGIVVGIGHTDAKDTDIDHAVEAGARLSTHLGNGAHAVLPRHRNYIQKQLAVDALVASLISDGHHLPSYVVKNMIRCKSVDRVILVTDAMAAAAAPPGNYRLGEVLAEVGPDGYVRLPGTPYLAGSALTMDRAIENAARFAALTIEDALRLANRQPRMLFADMGEGIRPGERADLVVLREGPPLTVVATVAEGEVVYQQS